VRGLYVGTTGAGAQDTVSWDATAQAWTYTDGATHLRETYDAAGTLRTLQDPTTGATFTLAYDAASQQLTGVLDG
jgi:hypothetical protein